VTDATVPAADGGHPADPTWYAKLSRRGDETASEEPSVTNTVGAVEAVLVVDAGSHSLGLRVLGPDDRVLATVTIDEPPDQAGDALARFVAGAPAVAAAGHRMVHGGAEISGPVVVDDAVRATLEALGALAPLHVPPALAVLDQARRVLPDIPHVVCPDTAFHAGLPQAAATYALPSEWNRRYGLRRFGFHGLSYTWATRRAAALLGRPVGELQMVLTHLGGGCSACAVRDGRSVDTTMGLTPLEGLVMTTRSGSVDPGLLLWLQTHHGLTADELTDTLNHRSGLLGLSGTSADTRDLVAARAAGDEAARLALDVFSHRVRSGMASMAASLDRLDAVVFTGEIGWDQPEIRQEVCAGLGVLGLPRHLAAGREDDGLVSPPGAVVPVLVVETGEDRQIAAETRQALSSIAG
jgi:acetate kinase